MRDASVLMILLCAAACSGEPALDRLTVSPGEREDELKADGDSDSGPRAELKVMVDAYWIDDVRDQLGLDADLAEEREVWFYDSAELSLFDAGTILRARSVKGDDDDSTVKLRPLTADQVDPAWFEDKGFKCELDANPVSSVSSCSYTTEQEEDQIEEVADGERDLDTLFSSEQEDFLAAHGPSFYWYWEDLLPLGPVDALVWKMESDSLEFEITAEHWDLPGEEMLELSIKVDLSEADQRMSEFLDWLAYHDVPLSAEQESKTRRALEALRGEYGSAEY
jgi:hypothetical protein